MKYILWTMLLLSFALASQNAIAASGQENVTQRYALIIGSNDGGEGRAMLRYGTTDAQSFSKVLSELGGTEEENQIILLNPTAENLEAGLEAVRGILVQGKARGERQELIVYYSGHSDEKGLLLFGKHYRYKTLRSKIASIPADVRIAILDSCASGAMTRTKGGKHKPAFLIDESSSVTGHAILTSASESESAQESDQIGASFFTHYLVSGLRGAADATQDGQITLNEAYQFAFHETLARTEATRSGAQHPAYDIQLSGTGDLVLTDLKRTSASLIVASKIHGRLFVRNAQGALVAELFKPPGREVELGLAEGDYMVTLDRDGEVRQGIMTLNAGNDTRLTPDSLSQIVSELNRTRGGQNEISYTPNVGLLPWVDSGTFTGTGHDHALSIGLAGSGGRHLQGAEFAPGFTFRSGKVQGIQASTGFNIAAGDLSQGIQATTGFNIAGDTEDMLQASAGFNIAGSTTEFAQATAGFNIAGGAPTQDGQERTKDMTSEGFQASAGFNVFSGNLEGFQASAGFNYASRLRGFQASALNIAGDVDGAQVGIINIGGRVTGTQVGILNISENADAPIGLINVSSEGIFQPAIWGSSTYTSNLALKLGGRYTYTLIGAGLTHGENKIGSLLFGFGGHIPLENPAFHYVELDLVASSPTRDFGRSGGDLGFNLGKNGKVMGTLRLSTGHHFLSHLGIFAGIEANVLTDWKRSNEDLIPSYIRDQKNEVEASREKNSTDNQDDTAVYIWPGLFAGVHF